MRYVRWCSTQFQTSALRGSFTEERERRIYLKAGKRVVVVVVSAPTEGRHWIITAYLAKRLAEGAVKWRRS
jgi:hypothetical protein